MFLLGQPDRSEIQENIEAENADHHDLVQGSFKDTYDHLSYKNIMGKLWVSIFCEQAEFIVKTDDDMFVDLYEVFALTRSYKNNAQYQDHSFLLCPVLRTLPILRDPLSKWFVSYDDIPKQENAAGDQFYPKSCTGWIYITTPGTARRLAKAAINTWLFWIDDVWVTGFLAEKLRIEHQDMHQFWSMKAEELLLHKTMQSPHMHHIDYISGPMHRNYELSKALHNKAEWCFVNK